MRLSELLRAKVRTESGERLGTLYDLRAELTGSSLRVIGLCAGRVALFERLGVGSPESVGKTRTDDVVPWSAVVRANRNEIVVRDGTKLN
jgi:sporulation protein YlmC with PRC-barrel domain